MKLTGLICLLFSFTTAPCQSISLHELAFGSVKDTRAYFHYNGDGFFIISGHRGGAMKGYPENCIPTFEHTLSETTAMFEIDPHLTKDSGIVLLHDPVLDRVTTGRGKLNDHTLAQVEKLQLRDAKGNVTPYHLNTLAEAIEWAKGKTIINLDVKDVPLRMKADLVKKYNAFPYVMFTVHNAKEAAFFYRYDHRSMFSAWMLTREAFDAYAKTNIPWSRFLIAYIGPKLTPENQVLLDLLHKKGVMVMIGAAPSFDKLPTVQARAEAYRALIKDSVDIIESDRPIEVAAALKSLYPKKSGKYRYWKKAELNR